MQPRLEQSVDVLLVQPSSGKPAKGVRDGTVAGRDRSAEEDLDLLGGHLDGGLHPRLVLPQRTNSARSFSTSAIILAIGMARELDVLRDSSLCVLSSARIVRLRRHSNVVSTSRPAAVVSIPSLR